MVDLPSPVTVNDLLVRAVIDRLGEQTELLRGILDRLPEPKPVGDPPAAGQVELVEPSAGKRPAERPHQRRTSNREG